MTKSVGAWFTQGSFAPADYHFGSEGSGSILGPGEDNWDLAAIKNFKIVERVTFQLRGEFFNAFNHESFSTVDSSLSDSKFYSSNPTFGEITGGHEPRRIQIGGKINF